MNKKGEANVPAIVLLVFAGVAVILVASFVYMSLNGKDYSNEYSEKIQSGEITNPIEEFALVFSKSKEDLPEGTQVIKIPTKDGEKRIIIHANLQGLSTSDIEDELVRYSAIVLKLYNLHEIPFFRTTPKVQVNIDEQAYNLEVKKGDLIIRDGEVDKEDIIIRTNHEEIFKMIEDNSYASESISSGRTSIEPIANKIILFSKGYLTLYNEFNSISGSTVIAF